MELVRGIRVHLKRWWTPGATLPNEHRGGGWRPWVSRVARWAVPATADTKEDAEESQEHGHQHRERPRQHPYELVAPLAGADQRADLLEHPALTMIRNGTSLVQRAQDVYRRIDLEASLANAQSPVAAPGEPKGVQQGPPGAGR
jgi:hypothetical protein